MRVTHPIPPFFDENSKILILGSFPSVKSREQMFFYGHKQNRFWRVVSGVFRDDMPETVEEKKAFLKRHGIALWDTVFSCEITGSADSTIKDVTACDISPILESADIKRIFVNGRTAEKYYNKLIRDHVGRDAVTLPSTSPANAAWSVDMLIDSWRKIDID